jgi:hypothetical protein
MSGGGWCSFCLQLEACIRSASGCPDFCNIVINTVVITMSFGATERLYASPSFGSQDAGFHHREGGNVIAKTWACVFASFRASNAVYSCSSYNLCLSIVLRTCSEVLTEGNILQ